MGQAEILGELRRNPSFVRACCSALARFREVASDEDMLTIKAMVKDMLPARHKSVVVDMRSPK